MRRLVPVVWLSLLVAPAAAQPPSFMSFEAGQVRPLALSADGATLYVVNTPDARLEIFDLAGATPSVAASVAVGLEPVAVAVESPGRVWVVNHLSDSVSIVDTAADPPRVVRTLLVGDEPRDLVFAGASRRRAFITTAHRGQNAADPRGQHDVPGVGRADVYMFDADDLGAALGGEPLGVLTLFSDVPRALAVSPDGATVYAAAYLSGNRTTTVGEGAVCDGGPSVGPCEIEGVTYPGGLPAPTTNHEGWPGPEVGLIVRQRTVGGAWEDELGRDWSPAVRFELPDLDVFAIDANADPPREVASYRGVGTALFGMAVHPSTGDVYVANTEAHNEVRFEGPGTYVRERGLRPGQPASVRGHLHEARITRISGATVTPVHLNPHIDYEATVLAPDIRHRTLATPTALAFSADGSTLYVAALGSSAIGVLTTADLDAGAVDTSLARVIPLRDPWPGGPTGLVLDEARARLYVLTRFDNALTTVDLATRSVESRVRMHSPEDEATVVGRPILYDALATSSNGESSCGSCHLFSDLDGLAWDLGDPDGDIMMNPNPTGPIGTGAEFHPLKGPMTTQSLRGLANHGPMHWRGDRTGGAVGGDPLDEIAAFVAFNAAFDGLLGRDEGPLTAAEMRRFAEFATRIMYPPNPIRQLDNTLRADETAGQALYGLPDLPPARFVDAVTTCNGCHRLDRAQGFFGSGGETTFENETQEFKVAHLRNLYQKVGMFGMASVPFLDNTISFDPTGPQVRGFGYLHDGSIDTAERFFHASVFDASPTEARNLQAFMMAFDTDLAPIVGQQVTLGPGPSAEQLARVDLLVARASTPMIWPGGATVTECDLVARGAVGGLDRGYLLEDDGMFHADRAADPALSLAELIARIDAGGAITFTCAPPGSGPRMAHDRDEDGVRDRDELDGAEDPADRPLFDIPAIAVPGPDLPPLDGGVPGADAGVDASLTPPPPPEGGCGCRLVGGHAPGSSLLWALIAAALLRRRRRLGACPRARVLILVGGADDRAPRSDAELIAASIPSASIVVADGLSHEQLGRMPGRPEWQHVRALIEAIE